MDFLHNGVPRLRRKAVWRHKKNRPFRVNKRGLYNNDIRRLLSSYNICSKEEVVRQYDHEVQGGSVVKPFVGVNRGPTDAAVVRPLLDGKKAVAVGSGINPFYSDIDPFHMAQCAIDEAIRNVICVGADFKQIAVLDNFCWGNPERQEDLAGLVRAAKGCYELALYLKTPFISGKDSFYNEFVYKNKRITIPYTLLISALGIVKDYRKVLTSDFKKEGALVYMIGMTRNELGASAYARLSKQAGGNVPVVEKKLARGIFTKISRAVERGLILSLHDCSEGGLAVSLSEMSFSSGYGVNVFLDEVPKGSALEDYQVLFSESPTRFIAEVKKENKKEFEKALSGIPFGLIGCVNKEEKVIMYYKNNKIVDVCIDDLLKSFRGGFPDIFKCASNNNRA